MTKEKSAYILAGGGIIDARGAYIPVIRPCDVVGVSPTLPASVKALPFVLR